MTTAEAWMGVPSGARSLSCALSILSFFFFFFSSLSRALSLSLLLCPSLARSISLLLAMSRSLALSSALSRSEVLLHLPTPAGPNHLRSGVHRVSNPGPGRPLPGGREKLKSFKRLSYWQWLKSRQASGLDYRSCSKFAPHEETRDESVAGV